MFMILSLPSFSTSLSVSARPRLSVYIIILESAFPFLSTGTNDSPNDVIEIAPTSSAFMFEAQPLITSRTDESISFGFISAWPALVVYSL